MINLIERVPKIPIGWSVENAREQLILDSGQRPSDMVTDDLNDIPSIGGENITDDGFLTFNNLRYVRKDYFDKTNKGILELDDILINKDGANTGKIALYNKHYFEKALVNEHVFIVRNKGKYCQSFLFYFLFSFYGQKQLQSRITGSAQGGLNTGFTKALALITPPIPEQCAIAGILSKVDEAIEATEKSIKSVEKLKKSLIQNLLTGKIKPDGTLRTEEEFNINEKFGKVPKGWDVKKLKEISKIERGKFGHRPRNEPRFYGGKYPFIQTSDIVNSGLYIKCHTQTLNEKGLSISTKFPIGTIAITIAANIGDVGILKYEMCFPDSLIGIIPNKEISSEYLAFFLMTKKRLLNQLAPENAQKNINYSYLRPLNIFFPIDTQEQNNISNILIIVENTIDTKQSKIQTLKTMKKSLMQSLLTGKVRVDVAKINELLSES